MKAKDIKHDNLVKIKKINVSDMALKIRLLEMGILNSSLNIVDNNKKNDYVIIQFRNTSLVINREVINNIEVI